MLKMCLYFSQVTHSAAEQQSLIPKHQIQLHSLMNLQDVVCTYHHFASDSLTLDSNSQPLVVFALSVETHWGTTQKEMEP